MQTQLVNFTIPKPLLQLADQFAQEEMKTRSEFFRAAVRSYLEQRVILKNRWKELLDYGAKQAQALNIKPRDVESIVDDYRSAL